jgi:hypothetical protein
LLVTAVDHLFDDTSLHPPASRSMAEALTAHAAVTSGPLARHVGPFVVPVSRLDEMDACVAAGRPRPDEIGVIAYEVGGGVPRMAARPGIVHVEAPLGTRVPELGGRVQRYLEVPHHADAKTSLDAVAAAGARLKVRCGGPGCEDVPSAMRLANMLVGAAERGLMVKATGGLDEPFARLVDGRHAHGYVNVLAAASLAHGGAGRTEVAHALAIEEPDADELLDNLARSRKLLASVGSSSVADSIGALADRGLL